MGRGIGPLAARLIAHSVTSLTYQLRWISAAAIASRDRNHRSGPNADRPSTQGAVARSRMLALPNIGRDPRRYLAHARAPEKWCPGSSGPRTDATDRNRIPSTAYENEAGTPA